MQPKFILGFAALIGALLIGVGIYLIAQKSSSGGGYNVLSSIVPTENKTVVMPGNSLWFDSGVSVKTGDTVVISATGSVVWARNVNGQGTVSPEGENFSPIDLSDQSGFPNVRAKCGSLLMKIGASDYAVGASEKVTVTDGGTIKFMANDRINWLKDNSGGFTITVKVYSAQ